MATVRWLGAFGKSASLADSLNWELSQSENAEVAAERLRRGASEILHASVGLLVKNSAVRKRFSSDVYSEIRGKKLVATRPQGHASSKHTEVFCKSQYMAIVVKKRTSAEVWAVCHKIAKKHGLPVLRLTYDGKFQEVHHGK